ncbi:MAG: S-layer homology domain-containing protein [Cyanobacteria bacterium P01_H01_bin.21]
MTTEIDWSTQTVVAIIGSLGAAAMIPGGALLAANTQSVYPDVDVDYWAQPFIQELSEADILTGYPDGTFRPLQAIDRDEYAAVIRQAFETEAVRFIPEASSFEDVPENYWASAAIEEAYETGFMGTPERDEFEPKSEITRADAVVALVQGLDLQTPVALPAAARTVQPVRRSRQTANRLMFPLAATATMQLFAPVASAVSPLKNTSIQHSRISTQSNVLDTVNTLDLSKYYADADQIPDYARDEVALATQAGLIRNYPEQNIFQPNQPITRGATAALIYQALVYKNELAPLKIDTP